MPRERFLWHDYETFGTDPAVDRPCQFAALATDENLNSIDESVTWFCQPTRDVLPHPMACLVTGITPQQAEREGVTEAEFAARIHDLMMTPGTCSVGYNSLNFDDEVTRHLLYRNFFDPYEREWRNGNSRFDLINLVRMCYALRPDGIEWPLRDDGAPSFRLEHLTAANGIEHGAAHDAMADVTATIELARLVTRHQPRLWDWALRLRDKRFVTRLLDPVSAEPLVHASGRIAAERGATSLVLPIADHPDQRGAVVVFDLHADPEPLMELNADEIADRLFTPARDLPEGVERIPLKLIRANRSPMLAPLATLKDADPHRIGLDVDRCLQHARRLRQQADLVRPKLIEVFGATPTRDAGRDDPELSLYAGFIDDADRDQFARFRDMDADEIQATDWRWRDPRLPELQRRYLARNHWDALGPNAREEWKAWVTTRLEQPPDARIMGWADFDSALNQAASTVEPGTGAQPIIDALTAWREQVQRWLGVTPKNATSTADAETTIQ